MIKLTPPIKSKPLEEKENGLFSLPWINFFTQLANRIQSTVDQVDTDVTELQEQIDEKQPLNDNLTGLSEYSGEGFVVCTQPNIFQSRGINDSRNITVSEKYGQLGNPEVSLNDELLDSLSVASADIDRRRLYYGSGVDISLDWDAGYAYDLSGTGVLSWSQQLAIDNNSLLSIDWGDRILYRSDGSVSFDWENDQIVTGETGEATINFGPANEYNVMAETSVTGISYIDPSRQVEAFFMADTTADHNEYEHILASELISLSCGNIVDGDGFTIYAKSNAEVTGQFKVRWRFL